MDTFTIIIGIISVICMITMIILYIRINNKISKSLTVDKIKVKDIEIDNNIDIDADVLIKGNYDYNKSIEKDKLNKINKNDLKIFYIKNDKDKSKIPMEFHLNEFIYYIYSTNKKRFMENDQNDEDHNDENHYIDDNKPSYIKDSIEDTQPIEKEDDQTNEEIDNKTEDEPVKENFINSSVKIEDFKNIQDYYKFYL